MSLVSRSSTHETRTVFWHQPIEVPMAPATGSRTYLAHHELEGVVIHMNYYDTSNKQ